MIRTPPYFTGLFALIWLTSEGALNAASNSAVQFNRDVLPILSDNCFACHGRDENKRKAGLRLDVRDEAVKQLKSGAVAIKPGDPAGSDLIRRVTTQNEEDHMPPAKTGKQLSAQQAATLRSWIKQGAVYENHWAFKPVERPVPPDRRAVKRLPWIRNDIDAFILARLQNEKLIPSPEADRATLLRRLSLDLIGLPPTPAEIDAFVLDRRPDAYERVVERLLASPHFGEKWARWWLDLAHYGDSDGYLTDQLRPHAWRYRQWVVDALNENLPFDQFTVQQIAGDLLPNATPAQKIATGFQRNTLSNREGGADLEEFRVEQVVDRTSTLGTVWLGLTLGCARCHDHKYDPVTQQEFYQLYAFFNEADEINIDAPLPGECETFQKAKPDYDRKRRELLAAVAAELAELQAQWEQKLLDAEANPGQDHRWDRALEVLGLIWGGGQGEGQLEGVLIVKTPLPERTAEQKDRLRDYFLKNGSLINEGKFKTLKLDELSKKLEALAKELPAVGRAPTLVQSREPRKTFVHARGDFRQRGVEAPKGTPSMLSPLRAGTATNRLALAHWLVSSENPLTARVTVNRLWQELFGRGLVLTSENLGVQGSRPSHPELLDWLASEFVARDWGVKQMLRLMVTSATYRQSSNASEKVRERDPENVLLARHSRTRLSAELVRDSALAVSGLLERKTGGPSVRPPQPESVSKEGFENKWETSQGADKYRRGLYTFIQRLSPFAQFVTFDMPETSRACTRRGRSNSPLQALNLLNDPVFVETACALASRILAQPRLDTAERAAYGFKLCVGRNPLPEERARLARYVEQQTEILRHEPEPPPEWVVGRTGGIDSREAAAWVALSSVLLNLDEFITKE